MHFSSSLRSTPQTRLLNPQVQRGTATPLPITCISVGLLQEVGTGVHVCKCADTQAIGGMQLRLQEVTAVLANIHELQQAGCWEQHLEEKMTFWLAGSHRQGLISPKQCSNQTTPKLKVFARLSTTCPSKSKLLGLDFEASPALVPTTLHFMDPKHQQILCLPTDQQCLPVANVYMNSPWDLINMQILTQ